MSDHSVQYFSESLRLGALFLTLYSSIIEGLLSIDRRIPFLYIKIPVFSTLSPTRSTFIYVWPEAWEFSYFAGDVSSGEKFRLVRVSRRSRILIDAKFRG